MFISFQIHQAIHLVLRLMTSPEAVFTPFTISPAHVATAHAQNDCHSLHARIYMMHNIACSKLHFRVYALSSQGFVDIKEYVFNKIGISSVLERGSKHIGDFGSSASTQRNLRMTSQIIFAVLVAMAINSQLVSSTGDPILLGKAINTAA